MKFDFKYIDNLIYTAVAIGFNGKISDECKICLIQDVYHFIKLAIYTDKLDDKFPQFYIDEKWQDNDIRRVRAMNKLHNLIQKRLQLFVNKGLFTRGMFADRYRSKYPSWRLSTPHEIAQHKLERKTLRKYGIQT